MSIVVDASVALKWFFEEDGSDRATDLLRVEDELIAPDLIYSEVGNATWKRVRNGSISGEEAEGVVVQLLAVPLMLADVRPLMGAAMVIAVEHDRTIYDSVYLALALRRGCQLVTSDERLVNALAGTGLAGVVRFL